MFKIKMHKKLRIHTDGSSKGNPGPMTVGVAVYEGGKLIKKISKKVGIGTNNKAEYLAVINALDTAKQMGAEEIEFFSDSQLLVNQLNGKYAVHSSNIRDLFKKVNELKQNFKKVTFKWVPREENVLADELSNGK